MTFSLQWSKVASSFAMHCPTSIADISLKGVLMSKKYTIKTLSGSPEPHFEAQFSLFTPQVYEMSAQAPIHVKTTTKWDVKAPARMTEDPDYDSEELAELRQRSLSNLGW